MSEATTQSENNTNGIKIPVLEREELILNKRSYNWITERICGVVENRQPFLWWILFIPSAIIALVGVVGGLFCPPQQRVGQHFVAGADPFHLLQRLCVAVNQGRVRGQRGQHHAL